MQSLEKAQSALSLKWADLIYRPTGARSRLATAAILLGTTFIALVLGTFIGLFGGIFMHRPVLAIALPAILILSFMVLLGRPALLFGILMFRAGLDPLLDGTQLPFGGASMGLGGVLNGLIILLTIASLTEQPTKMWKRGATIFLPFLAILFVGVIRSPLPAMAVKQFLSIATVFSVFLLGIHLAERKGYQYVLKIVLTSCIIPFGVSIVMFATGWKFGYTAHSSADLQGSEAGRFAGPFSHSNVLAFYVLTLAVVALHVRVAKLSTQKFIRTASLILVFSLVLLLMTKTRSAWGICVLLLVVHGVVFERKLIPLLILGGAIALTLPPVRERLFDLKDQRDYLIYAKLDSYAWRKLIWTQGLHYLHTSQYVLGKGVMSFFDDSLHFFTLAGGEKRYPHSIYVQLIYENGLIGLGIYLGLLATITLKFMRALKHNRSVAVTGVMLTFLYATVCYSDNVLDYLVFNIYIWITLGALYYVALSGTSTPITEPNQTRPGN